MRPGSNGGLRDTTRLSFRSRGCIFVPTDTQSLSPGYQKEATDRLRTSPEEKGESRVRRSTPRVEREFVLMMLMIRIHSSSSNETIDPTFLLWDPPL